MDKSIDISNSKRTTVIQITLMTAVKVTGSVVWSGTTGWEDITTLVRSSASSVLKLAVITLLYLCNY